MATLTDLLLTGSYTLALRAVVLQGNLDDTLAEVPGDVLEGGCSFDSTREIRRTGRGTLNNSSGLYTPSGTSALTWPGRIWRIERGALVGTTPQYVPLMTGILNTPVQSARSKTIPFSLSSRLSLLNTPFSAPLVFATGMRLEDLVLQVGGLGGLGTDPALYALNDNGATLGADRPVTEQDNMLQFLFGICRDYALVLGDDALGRTTLAPWQDPSTTDPAWTFDVTRDAVTLDVQRTLQAHEQVFNRANVSGIAPDHYPIEAEARDLNPLSPTYNPLDGSGPLGDRPRSRYTSADIHDQATANAMALRLLYEGALYDEGIAVRGVPLPGVEDNQVASIVGAGANDRYLLATVDMPWKDGEMTATTSKVRSLIAP